MPNLWMWVEGKGEQPDRETGKGGAAPLLVRRLLKEKLGQHNWQVIRPLKVGNWRNFQKRAQQFVDYLRRRPDVDAVLVLLDLDEGCAKMIAPQLAETLKALKPPRPIAIVFAVREYEAWFLAAAKSLWGQSYEGDPEGPRDAKDQVSRFEPEYTPTTHQSSLSAKMNLDEAFQKSRSFRRLFHALQEIIWAVDHSQVAVTPAYSDPPEACHSGQSAEFSGML